MFPFNYETNITGTLDGSNIEKKVEIVVPVRRLSSFWKILDKLLTIVK